MFVSKSIRVSMEQFERNDGIGPLNLFRPISKASRLGQENRVFDGRLPNKELVTKEIPCREEMLKMFWGIAPMR